MIPRMSSKKVRISYGAVAFYVEDVKPDTLLLKLYPRGPNVQAALKRIY
jgi:hypothetical protein